MYKKCSLKAEEGFYGAYGEFGVRVASAINSGIKDAINTYSSKCFSLINDNTTVHEVLCHGIRIMPTWG